MLPVIPLVLSLSSGYAVVLPNTTASWQSPMFPLTRIGDTPGNLSMLRLADNTSITGPLVMGYYPDWAGNEFPPEKIDFSHFDWVDFAFAVPDKSFALTWDDPAVAPDLLRRLVNLAHAQGKKVKLSVGGWTGSKYFSSAVATQENREWFAQNILQSYQDFDLDGIDIDWEYPGQSGDAGNLVSADDSNNFLLFLHQLRSLLPPSAIISAAATQQPFVDGNGQIMRNVADFAEVLDWVLIMNYDTWNPSRTPGPNAPMYDACKNSTQPNANAVGAYESWVTANFPPSKLTLGLPTYGYVSRSFATSLRTRRLEGNSKGTLGNVTKVLNSDGDPEGEISFRELVRQGVLAADPDPLTGKVNFVGSGGFEREWDECSCTPFLRSASAGQVISYDDPHSLRMKAEFAQHSGMLGVNLFDIWGDTDEWDLTTSVANVLLSDRRV